MQRDIRKLAAVSMTAAAATLIACNGNAPTPLTTSVGKSVATLQKSFSINGCGPVLQFPSAILEPQAIRRRRRRPALADRVIRRMSQGW